MSGLRAMASAVMLALVQPAVAAAQTPSAPPAAGQPLTVDAAVGELLDNPGARAVLRNLVPALVDNPQIGAARNLPLRAIAGYTPTLLTDAVLRAIDAELARTPGAVASGKMVVATPASRDPREALTLKTIPLWEGKAPGALGNRPQDMPTLTVVPPGETASFGSAVIVAPGGGYQALASAMEGRQVADWFAAHGVTAFVLTYRLTPFGYAHPTQLIDAQRAIRWVRAHAADYGVNPERIGMIGFSAGGHLAAMAETRFDPGQPGAADPIERASSRPDFVVLSYAAIDLPSNRWNTLGLTGPNTPKARLGELNPAANVRRDSPPTFLWQTTTDELVPPSNAIRMYEALVGAGVPAELHIFGEGHHGMGLGMTDQALSAWPNLLRTWLNGIGVIGPKAVAGK